MSRRPAEVFPPGDFIREELNARGWSQRDLAGILGRPLQAINAIVNGKKAITPRTATELGQAFGTSAEFWLNLDTAYRLSLVGPADPSIARRASERRRAVAPRRLPVSDLISRLPVSDLISPRLPVSDLISPDRK